MIRFVMKNCQMHESTATHGIECFRYKDAFVDVTSSVMPISYLFPLMQFGSDRIITTHYFLITYKQPVAQVKS